MRKNTLKTVRGFLKEAVYRWTPFKRKTESLENIYNYLDIEGLYATSGQPGEEQFSLIRDAGYQVVINLAPNSVLENAIVNERETLDKLGVDYIHTAVDFKNPTDQDFDSFVQNIRANSGKKIWVHCAANMRVSAFTYRYRTQVLGLDQQTARQDLDKIWAPFGVWKKFISV